MRISGLRAASAWRELGRVDGGKLVCGGKPNGCVMEFEKCSVASDCCPVPGAQVDCINGFCATSTPVE